ncbi:MAG: right-handed parallel beta-helix repeat-containing protein [Rikenellaceae bacterium]
MKRIITILLLFGSTLAYGATYYVSPTARKGGDGSSSAPFTTLVQAVKSLQPGDVCMLAEGIYTTPISLRDFGGDKSISFVAEQGAKVVFSGCVELSNLKWESYKGAIYSAKIDRDISQLFVDDVAMTAARFPNGNWRDGSVWDKSQSMLWPEEGEFGHYYNEALKGLDFSLAGGKILLNSGSFKTYATTITEHVAGSDNLKCEIKGVGDHFKTKTGYQRHGYFVEGKKELVDVEGEWFYDRGEKRIYLYAPGGVNPSKMKISGKVESLIVKGDRSRNIIFKGVEFFGTTVRFVKSRDVAFVDCKFLYPSDNMRMLDNLSIVQPTQFAGGSREDYVGAKFINCYFAYGDGPALSLRGADNVIENCTFHDFDISCINAGGFMFDLGQTSKMIFRRNRAWNTGNSEMLQVGSQAVVELNDLSRCGFLQNDGAVIQVSVPGQDGTVVRYNWLHDAIKQALRFDNVNQPDAPWGRNGTAHHNVTWRTERVFFKGDEHFIFNNLCFDNEKNDLIISSNLKINGRNFKTITRNNISGQLSGDTQKPRGETPPPGDVSHNWEGAERGADVRSQLRDPDNLDFRPRKGAEIIDAGVVVDGKDVAFLGSAPDIGAYEYGAEEYWIPGPKMSVASVAIPTDGTTTAKPDADLMWLGSYRAKSYEVYFGAAPDRLKLVSKQGNNIYTPKQRLDSGSTYYWRVDCVEDGGVAEGEVWSFKVQ